MSTSEVESLWEVEYDDSKVLDWEPLVSGHKCLGLVFKVVAWDETTDILASSVDDVPLRNQRTTRSSFGDGSDDEEEEDNEGEEGFSAVGENDEIYTSDDSRSATRIPLKYLLQTSNRNHISNFMDNHREYKFSSMFYDPPVVSHVRHNKIRNIVNPIQIFDSSKKKENSDYFEHPTLHFHQKKQTSIGENNDNLPQAKVTAEIIDKSSPAELYQSSHKRSDLYQRENEIDDNEMDERNSLDLVDYRPSPLDFELPINIYGLPMDANPPDGYALQRLTEYIVLVKFNGSMWSDMTIKKAPIFQLCKNDICIPNEEHANKLGNF